MQTSRDTRHKKTYVTISLHILLNELPYQLLSIIEHWPISDKLKRKVDKSFTEDEFGL